MERADTTVNEFQIFSFELCVAIRTHTTKTGPCIRRVKNENQKVTYDNH